jgi:hypothetical protein
VKTCDYCLKPAELIRFGEAGYPYRKDYGPVWCCQPCGAWCGCHDGTENALGRLANAELRAAKMKAHAAFDPLWKTKMDREKCSKSHARKSGYRWLAKQLAIPYKQCHIGMFDVEQCLHVVEICNAVSRKEPA